MASVSSPRSGLANLRRRFPTDAEHGAADPKKMNLIEKWMVKNVQAPMGDFRDWDAIHAWASAIADALLRETT